MIRANSKRTILMLTVCVGVSALASAQLANPRQIGTPIAMTIRNTDARGKDYAALETAYRPSHADYTYDAKYGVRAVAISAPASVVA